MFMVSSLKIVKAGRFLLLSLLTFSLAGCATLGLGSLRDRMLHSVKYSKKEQSLAESENRAIVAKYGTIHDEQALSRLNLIKDKLQSVLPRQDINFQIPILDPFIIWQPTGINPLIVLAELRALGAPVLRLICLLDKGCFVFGYRGCGLCVFLRRGRGSWRVVCGSLLSWRLVCSPGYGGGVCSGSGGSRALSRGR